VDRSNGASVADAALPATPLSIFFVLLPKFKPTLAHKKKRGLAR